MTPFCFHVTLGVGGPTVVQITFKSLFSFIVYCLGGSLARNVGNTAKECSVLFTCTIDIFNGHQSVSIYGDFGWYTVSFRET